MNPTVKDIIGIKPGKLRAFICDSPKGCNSARVQVQHVKRMYIPEGVENYTVHTQWEDNIVVVTAIAKQKDMKRKEDSKKGGNGND